MLHLHSIQPHILHSIYLWCCLHNAAISTIINLFHFILSANLSISYNLTLFWVKVAEVVPYDLRIEL